MANLRTVDLLEHVPHSLDVVVVEEPCLWVLLVFLERNAERVRDVDRLAVVLSEEHADYTLRGALCYGPLVVVCYGEQY